MSEMLSEIKSDLKALATQARAENAARYFKTGLGEYGEGDIFIGVTVPDTRKIAKRYKDIHLEELDELAHSKIHEERLCALLILNHKYTKAKSNEERRELFEFWLVLLSTDLINNWDLIDTSAPVVGEILSRHLGYGAPCLHEMAKSDHLWTRRAAIMLTFPLIRIGKFGPTKAIALDLIEDKHDLIHKASGWMLREIGNRDKAELTDFLNEHKDGMPRTMLRYAIEKYTPQEREWFLIRD